MHFEVQSFGVNAWTAAEAGARLIGEHGEIPSGHEELYLVTAGRATFTVDGEEVDAGVGTVVFVADPAVKRGAIAQEAATTVFAVGVKPGEAYKPRAWETNALVYPLFERGELAEAKLMLNEALGRYDDREGLLYNLACAEAQLGEIDQALEHLATALAAHPDYVELARGDDDLAALREDPRFAELVAALGASG